MSALRRVYFILILVCAVAGAACGRGSHGVSAATQSSAGNGGTGNAIVRFVAPAKIRLEGDNVTVRVPLNESESAGILKAAKDGGQGRVFLKLVGIEYQQNPGAGYEVYLNLPPGQAPERKSMYYAGVLHFYGLKQTAEASGQPATMQFDVSEAIHHLQQASQWSDNQLSVTFARRGPLSPSGTASQAQGPENVPSIAELDIVVE